MPSYAEYSIHCANVISVNQKQRPGHPEHVSSQCKQPLEFPPFHQNILMQKSWNAKESNGRIKVLLSEQLINNAENPGEVDFGPANGIVCFSFQHAPQGMLFPKYINFLMSVLIRESRYPRTGGDSMAHTQSALLAVCEDRSSTTHFSLQASTSIATESLIRRQY